MYYPYKNFRTPPPKNTPNYTEKLDFRYDFVFLIETKRKKLQMRLSRSILRILQWRCVQLHGLNQELRFRKNEKSQC